MPNAKFNPFPFASLVEVPVSRADRRWPKANTPWPGAPRAAKSNRPARKAS